MRKITIAMMLAAVLALTAGPVMAQAKQAAKAPKPAPGPATEVAAAWNEIGRKVIAMAEDFPEDKYDWKPTPEVRSFAEQILHVAGANGFFTATVKGEKLGEEDLPRAKYKTKADVVAALKKSFADGAAVIKEKGDAGMGTTVKHPFSNSMVRISALAYDLAGHAGEHYGQLVVYYRVSKMVPPESRPSK